MLDAEKLQNNCKRLGMNTEQVAEHLVRGSFNKKKAVSAVKNWKKGLFKPVPKKEDVQALASAFGVEGVDIKCWHSVHKYAPGSARKARKVADLIKGRHVQDAMDMLKFTDQRAAVMFDKVLKAAVADADEQQADLEDLYVTQARVDDAGVRIGTKRWFPKDRGRAHPIRKKACHIHVTVSMKA
jgi:large subunit ribosomal protein L22